MISIAAWLFTLCGVALVAIAGYFVAFRPSLLPEDARFMGATAEQIVGWVPGLAAWLRRVFWVLGGYMASTGVLVVFVANTGLRAGDVGAAVVLATAGLFSVCWMTTVNFMIGSDFRWALLLLAVMWVSAVAIAVAAL